MATQEIIRIGRCIYCGATGAAPSKEHAIPYGLSGDFILHDASCQKCAAITSAFEKSCLRGLLARTRARLNLKSRRPKPVATVFKMDRGFGWEKTELDAKQFAGINILPLFEPPAFLSGGKIDGQIKIRGWDHLNLGSPVPVLPPVAKKTTVTLEYKIDLDVWSFARMIAKIGYCCAVAHLGFDKISEAYVLPAILKQKDDVQTWVGSEDILFNRTPDNLHLVEIFVKGETIFALVCLFAAFGGKPYTVVVGKYKREILNSDSAAR